MSEFWQIRPRGDGYNYLGFKNGQHILISKDSDKLNLTLLFSNKISCEKYIRKNLKINEYESEKVWLNEEYYNITDTTIYKD